MNIPSVQPARGCRALIQLGRVSWTASGALLTYGVPTCLVELYCLTSPSETYTSQMTFRRAPDAASISRELLRTSVKGKTTRDTEMARQAACHVAVCQHRIHHEKSFMGSHLPCRQEG